MAFSIGNIPLTAAPGAIQGIGSGNALIKQGLENQYYGPTQMANIASKNTYARYLPAQILGQVLSNPLVWQTMPKEQLQALSNQYANALVNPPSIESLSGAPSNSLLSRVVNWIGNQFSPNQNALTSLPSTQNQNPMVQAPANTETTSGQSDITPPSQGPQQLPNTLINRLAPGYRMPGSQGGINPATVQGAQAKGLETTATGEAAAQTQAWSEITKTDADAAKAAQNNIIYLNKLRTIQPKLKGYEKGPVFGALPAFTGAAYDYDTTASALANSVAQANEQGHITDTARSTYFGMKPNRRNPDESFKHLVDFNDGMNMRVSEKPAFDNAAKIIGLDPNQAQAVWTYYSNKKPFYDGKTNKILKDNIGTWEDFLTPEKVAEALSPKEQKKAASTAVSKSTFSTKNNPSTTGFNPAKMLDYKYKTQEEFQAAFDTLSPEAKQEVLTEMQRRGMH